jgi:hypothetical protein
MRWTGEEWEGFGGSASGEGLSDTRGTSSVPSLALDSSGTPYVAWAEREGERRYIYLRYWDGATWNQLGGSATRCGISGPAGDAWFPRLVLDSKGRPIVAWYAGKKRANEVFVKRWNGAAWVDLGLPRGANSGMSVTPDADSRDPDMALLGSRRVVVAWNESPWVYLRHCPIR